MAHRAKSGSLLLRTRTRSSFGESTCSNRSWVHRFLRETRVWLPKISICVIGWGLIIDTVRLSLAKFRNQQVGVAAATLEKMEIGRTVLRRFAGGGGYP